MFRYKKTMKADYLRQGYAYFLSHRYDLISPGQRAQMDALFLKCGGIHADALRDYMTRDLSAVTVCREHYLSERTLMRAVHRYYENFPDNL